MTDTAKLRRSANDCHASALYAPLIITGMHRSGTSLTAALLNRAGMHVGIRLNPGAAGNPLGYFENLDFVRLNERILNSLGHPREGWIFNHLERIPAHFYEDALETVSLNATEDMWGFKDPRTALMLDFWHEILPQARFLLTARAPWQVADSLFRRGDSFFKNSPRLAVEVWQAYNENILQYYRRHKDSCLLATLDGIVANPDTLITALNEKFGLHLRIPEKPVYKEQLLQREGSGAQLFEEIVRSYYPGSLQLWRELQQECLLKPDAANIEPNETTARAFTDCNAFERLHNAEPRQQMIELLSLKLKEQSREKQTTEFARDTLAKENALLKQELSRVRTSQENHCFEIIRHETQIQELRATVQTLSQHLHETTNQLQEARLKTHLALCQLGHARLQLLRQESGSNEDSSNESALENDNELKQNLQSALLQSRSWRVVDPLRRLSRLTNLRALSRKMITALNHGKS